MKLLPRYSQPKSSTSTGRTSELEKEAAETEGSEVAVEDSVFCFECQLGREADEAGAVQSQAGRQA